MKLSVLMSLGFVIMWLSLLFTVASLIIIYNEDHALSVKFFRIVLFITIKKIKQNTQ